jgi:hypothetical protein
MTNEPIAWINRKGKDGEHGYLEWDKDDEAKINIPLYTNLVKELTREDRLKLIGTLKWAEDLLREAGHDEAVDEVQDCIMLLRKAQEK